MPVESFDVVAEKWLADSQTRKRKPIRASTVPTIRGALNKWILPALGKMPLDKIHNGTLKPMVQAMQAANLASKTQNAYVQFVKNIVASVIDP